MTNAQATIEAGGNSQLKSERQRPPRTAAEFTLLATVAASHHMKLEEVARLLGVPDHHAFWLLVSDTGGAFIDWLCREVPHDILERFRPAADTEAEAKAGIAAPQAEAPSVPPPIELPKTCDEVLRELGLYGTGPIKEDR